MAHQLRNVAVRDLIAALLADGFTMERSTRTGGRVYRSERERRTVLVHYHHGGDTLPLGTLRSIIEGARWTFDDARRLRLVE